MRIASDDAGTRTAESLSASIAATARRRPDSHAEAPGAVNTASMSASYAARDVRVLLEPAKAEPTTATSPR